MQCREWHCLFSMLVGTPCHRLAFWQIAGVVRHHTAKSVFCKDTILHNKASCTAQLTGLDKVSSTAHKGLLYRRLGSKPSSSGPHLHRP